MSQTKTTNLGLLLSAARGGAPQSWREHDGASFDMDQNLIAIDNAIGGETPGGSNGQIQFNNAGAFGGIPSSYDSVDDLLVVGAPFVDMAQGDYWGAQTSFNSKNAGSGANYGFHAENSTITDFDYAFGFRADSGTNASIYSLSLETHITETVDIDYGEGFTSSLFGSNSGSMAEWYDFYASAPDHAPGITTSVNFYAEDPTLNSSPATNSYYLWFDAAGVYRVKYDTAHDSGNPQAIPALYNPRFTKYTPGAANLERIVLEWDANIAQIGTEAEGTGTLRGLELIGASVTIDGNIGFFGGTPAAKQIVSGAKLPSDTVMASLLSALVAYGLITNSTT